MIWQLYSLHSVRTYFPSPSLARLLTRSLVFIVNLLGVRVFGELEFWFSSIKGTLPNLIRNHILMFTITPVIALIGLLLMGIIIDLGGNPQHERIGFRYWKAPNGPMGHYLADVVDDEPTSIFVGFWAVMVNALFAYMGTELIGVTVGEVSVGFISVGSN